MKTPGSPSDLQILCPEPEEVFMGPQVTAMCCPLGVTHETALLLKPQQAGGSAIHSQAPLRTPWSA